MPQSIDMNSAASLDEVRAQEAPSGFGRKLLAYLSGFREGLHAGQQYERMRGCGMSHAEAIARALMENNGH